MPFDDAIRSMLREEIRAAMREELRALLPELRAPSTSEEFLSVPEAARLAKVSAATIRAWLRRKELKRYGTARLPRILRTDLIGFMANQAAGGAEQPRSVEEQAASIISRHSRSSPQAAESEPGTPAPPPRRAAPAHLPRPSDEQPSSDTR